MNKKGRNIPIAAIFCFMALAGVVVPATSGAARPSSAEQSDDVELGPATRIFATPEAADLGDGLPQIWRSGGDDGKGNGKGNDKDDQGSGGSGGDTEPRECWQWRPAEFDFLERLNTARVKHGRQRVTLDRELARVARRHTWEMVERDALYHTPDDVLRRRVTNWLILGENVGRGHTPESLFRAFMESEPHRENLLYRPFNYVGIGTMVDQDGMLWVTILLEAHDNPGTTLDVPPLCN